MADEPRHETQDMSARAPLVAVLGTLALLPLGALAMWWLLSTVWQAPPELPSPFAQPTAQLPEKAPRLQVDPSTDLAQLNERMQKRLNALEWVDRDAGIVRMPIERAIDVLADRGLPERGRGQNGRPQVPYRPYGGARGMR